MRRCYYKKILKQGVINSDIKLKLEIHNINNK